MNCLITFFTIFGVIAFVIAIYHFAIDQIGIYQLKKEWNKKRIREELKHKNNG